MAPAYLPERHVGFEADLLFQVPGHGLSLAPAFAHPDLTLSIFGATGDHLVHQADIRAPSYVAYPIVMVSNCDRYHFLLSIVQHPHLHCVVVSSSDDSLRRWLEFSSGGRGSSATGSII